MKKQKQCFKSEALYAIGHCTRTIKSCDHELVEIVVGYRTRTGQARGYARVRVRVWIIQPATFKMSPKTAKTVEK